MIVAQIKSSRNNHNKSIWKYLMGSLLVPSFYFQEEEESNEISDFRLEHLQFQKYINRGFQLKSGTLYCHLLVFGMDYLKIIC
jgi:hypothetical protein